MSKSKVMPKTKANTNKAKTLSKAKPKVEAGKLKPACTLPRLISQ
jgi:hypothetical protein